MEVLFEQEFQRPPSLPQERAPQATQSPPASQPAAVSTVSTGSGPARIDEILRVMISDGASDLHMSSNAPPYLRKDGEMKPLDRAPISNEQLFDIIITDSCKPDFQEDGGLPLYVVDPEDDSLSLVQCDVGQFVHHRHKENVAERGSHIFQGGNWQHLHAMLGLKSGEKVSSSKHHHYHPLHLLLLLLVTISMFDDSD